MSALLRVESPTGVRLGDLPDYEEMAHSVAASGLGGLQFRYPHNGLGIDVLLNATSVLVVVAAPHGDEFYWLDDDGDNQATEQGEGRSVEFAGRSFRSILDYGTVYPQDHEAGQPVSGYRLGGHSFIEATPGAIMSTLIARAQSRGALTGLTYDFDSDVDSNGTPWPQVISIGYPVGTLVSKVLDQLAEAALAEERVEGKVLRLFIPGTSAVDRPNAVLRLGQGVSEAPRFRTRQSVRTSLLSIGDDNRAVEIVDAAGVARYGRREAYEGRGGVTDYALLTQLATESMADMTETSENLTLAYIAQPGIPVAGIDFKVRDSIRYDQRRLSPTQLEPLRVNSIAWGYRASGSRIVSVDLADQWLTNAEKRKLRVDAIAAGSEAPWTLPTDRPGQDIIPPDDPTAVTLTASIAFSTVYNAAEQRESSASVIIDWTAPDRNVDGTIYDDHKAYFVSLLYPTTGGGEWTAEEMSADPGPITISGLPWSTGVQARVRAEDRHGNSSDWAYSNVVQTLASYSTPPKASTPALVTEMGHIGVTWDGKTATGSFPVAPVIGAEVHTSSTFNFTPSDSTNVDFLPGARTLTIRPPTYGQPTYVRLVLVDYLGQRGTPSDAASITTDQVVSADIFDGAIGTAKLADAAVVNAKIANGAIIDALITSFSAGAITAGSLAANILNAGWLRTAVTGGRVEVSAAGFAAYNPVGQVTTRFGTDGNALLSGTFGAIDIRGNVWFRTAPGQAYFNLDPSAGLFLDQPQINFASVASHERSSATYQQGLTSQGPNPRGYHTWLAAPAVYAPPASNGSLVQTYIEMLNFEGSNGTNGATDNVVPQAPIRFILDTYRNDAADDPIYSATWRNQIRFRDCFARGADGNMSANAPGIHLIAARGGNQSGIRAHQSCLDAVYEADAWGETFYAIVRAAAGSFASSSNLKHDIADIPFSALDAIISHPSKQWRLRHAPDQLRLGPMADNLPEQLVLRHGDDTFLDHSSGAGLLWAAFAELDEMLTAAGV